MFNFHIFIQFPSTNSKGLKIAQSETCTEIQTRVYFLLVLARSNWNIVPLCRLTRAIAAHTVVPYIIGRWDISDTLVIMSFLE